MIYLISEDLISGISDRHIEINFLTGNEGILIDKVGSLGKISDKEYLFVEIDCYAPKKALRRILDKISKSTFESLNFSIGELEDSTIFHNYFPQVLKVIQKCTKNILLDKCFLNK